MAATTVLLLLFTLLRFAVSRPTGAPMGACDTLTPAVGPHDPPQTTPSPYNISVEGIEAINGTYYYTPGQTYNVTLNGSAMLQGFLVQSRAYADGGLLRGVSPLPGATTVQPSLCTLADSGVTHTSSANKDMIQFQWTPIAGSGAVQFRYTVVQVQRTHWDNASSDVLMERDADPVPSASPVPSPMPGPVPGRCNNRVEIGAWSVYWGVNGNYVSFVVSGNTNGYVALGISNDNMMPNSDIIVGASDGTNYFVSDRYASARAPPVLDGTQNLMNTSTTLVNGRLTFRFTRPLVTGDSNQDVDLTTDTEGTGCTWFLVASGTVIDYDTGVIMYHGTRRSVSSGRVCLCSGAGWQTPALSVSLLIVLAVVLQHLL